MALNGGVMKTDAAVHATGAAPLTTTGKLLTDSDGNGPSTPMAQVLTAEDADEVEALKAMKSWKQGFN